MATILAPYSNAMKLGSGFNSFTQELCVDHAVIRDNDPKSDPLEKHKEKNDVAQSVVFKTSVVDKATDVTEALNINAAFSIKYDKLNADGNGKIVNTNTLKTSDLNFMISVKVVNEVVMDHTLTKFSAIDGLTPSSFTKIYGDHYISGFQEGGEFTAIISIKVHDRSQLENIKAEAALSLTMDKAEVSGEGGLDKARKNLLSENETTISVFWTGGGQDLKPSEDDWTFDTMKAAALRFPLLVAKTPMRTHAILTRYTSLKSFHTLGAQFSPLNYEHAGNYTAALQEAYLDYKNIAKDIQVLAFEVVNGTQALEPREGVDPKDFSNAGLGVTKPPAVANAIVSGGTAGSDTESSNLDNESFTQVKAGASSEEITRPPPSPLLIDKAYSPTIFGLEAARIHCRFMMNRIVQEVDAVTQNPQIATSETRPLPYMSPFLFKLLLPVAKPVIQVSI